MKNKIGVLSAIGILIGIPLAVKAAEIPEPDDTDLKSYGSIVYEDPNGSVKIYADDIVLLQEKLASVPDEIFDPILYSHTHVWEYINITDQSHTKHCDGCGEKYDLVNQHSAMETEECTIFSDGKEYPGYEMVCECGYRWKAEADHSLIYIPQNGTYHTLSCALDGTDYCSGTDSEDILHEIALQPADDTHHQNVCEICGYKGDIEVCVFDIPDADSLMEGGNMAEIRKYCECGNSITEPKEEVSGLNMTEPAATDAEAKNEGEQYGSEAVGETEEKTVTSDLDGLPEISVSGNSIDSKTLNTAESAEKGNKDDGEGENSL